MFDSFAYALSNLIINNLMLFLVRTVILSFWCSNGSVYFSTYLSLRASTYIHTPLYVNRFMHLTGKTHNFPFYFSVFTLTACEGLVRNSFLILNFPPDVCIMELIFSNHGLFYFFSYVLRLFALLLFTRFTCIHFGLHAREFCVHVVLNGTSCCHRYWPE